MDRPWRVEWSGVRSDFGMREAFVMGLEPFVMGVLGSVMQV